MSNFVNLMDIVYPVGSIYQSMNATSPASSIGGTWTQLKTFLYGSTTAKQTGGEATHKLTVNEMPAHKHHITNKPAGNNIANNVPYQIGGAGLDYSNTFIDKYVESAGGGSSAQQLATLHDLLHLVSHSVAALKANSVNLSKVAYV